MKNLKNNRRVLAVERRVAIADCIDRIKNLQEEYNGSAHDALDHVICELETLRKLA